MKILLVTGPAGHVHGWGDLKTTRLLLDALSSRGATTSLLYVQSMDELMAGLKRRSFDIVWSSLYFSAEANEIIGSLPESPWVQDIFESMELPYVGSSAASMRRMLDKAKTLALLAEQGVGVPWQRVVAPRDETPDVTFPVFAKPRFESESSGISESSVVGSMEQLRQRLHYIHETFRQDALVEEYLPGREFTVSMLGNGANRRFHAVENVIHPAGITRFPVITQNLKLDGWLDFKLPTVEESRTLQAVAEPAAAALQCADHVRLDMREDVHGRVKVLEINGIPGLNPAKSRSLSIHTLYREGCSARDCFPDLVCRIVAAALDRYGLASRWILPKPDITALSSSSRSHPAKGAP